MKKELLQKLRDLKYISEEDGAEDFTVEKYESVLEDVVTDNLDLLEQVSSLQAELTEKELASYSSENTFTDDDIETIDWDDMFVRTKIYSD